MPSVKSIGKRVEQNRAGLGRVEETAGECRIQRCGGRSATLGNDHAGCECCGHRIAITPQATRRAVMRALAERLGDALSAEAVLRERRRPRGGAVDAANTTGERCDGGGLALDRGQQQARREGGEAAAPPLSPRAEITIFDDELAPMFADDAGRVLPGEIATRPGRGFGLARIGGAFAPVRA